MLFRTDARYESSSMSPKVYTTRPLSTTTTPVEFEKLRSQAETAPSFSADHPCCASAGPRTYCHSASGKTQSAH